MVKSPSKTKTFRFLMAAMSGHGQDLSDILNKLSIFDVYIGHNDKMCPYCLYILVDGIETQNFNLKLDLLRTFHCLIEDYPVGDDLENRYHMLVIMLPEKHYNAYDKFLESKYSLMYEPSFVNTIFKRFPDRMEVLTRSNKYRKQLEANLDVIIEQEAELLDPIDYERETYKD